ncbi:Spy/CpxP family protein refolding chaperone [Alteromonas sp. 1_MG-2023]|uniref:Spy/CpxP family protein refolding chaperone n=1 Tax=Alteromonas sp. 1_MG-2023 TaxID=3062669 RepID=UPI0026E432F8|nr:Spy/CpxP family protein refolding chaperone [Alteromonas sp. 1_MG-2023]MDO6567861.1 Spy/CpxP family protein refolding chaperone [Alteromonas sp. 1_MG-2023]
MRTIIIAGLLATTFTLTHTVNAAPQGPRMPSHPPGMEMVKTLGRLSLTSEQKEEVKALIAAFKENKTPPEMPGGRPSKRPEIDSLNDTDIRALVEAKVLTQQAHHFAIAQLRSEIYNLLSESQRIVLIELEAEQNTMLDNKRMRDDKRFSTSGGKPMRPMPLRGPRLPFEDLQLSDEQLATLESLNETYRETRFQHKSTMDAFKNAEQALVRSGNFSESAWDALYAEYKEDIINAGTKEIRHMQAVFDVLTDAQQAELEQRREEDDELRRLFTDS